MLGYALLLSRMTSRVLYSAQYHRQHCTLHAFEQSEALYMHNHDDKYPSRFWIFYFLFGAIVKLSSVARQMFYLLLEYITSA